MLRIFIGVSLVIASVCTGYLMEQGNLRVLTQPAELLIIMGGATGSVVASCPARNLRMLFRALRSMRSRLPCTSHSYLEALKVLYVLFHLSGGAGKTALEPHVEQPYDSPVFQAHPSLLADSEVTDFICDSFRIAISAGLNADQVEHLMAIDMEIQRSGRQQPVRALTTLADSLPGLGIVAAVLGVVVTMQALNGPASEIGHKVAAALVGTFLGILLSYGVVGPMASHLEYLNKSRSEYLQVLRVAIVSSLSGQSPMPAAEAGRRSIPLDLRPTLNDMETELRRERIPRRTAIPGMPAEEV